MLLTYLRRSSAERLPAGVHYLLDSYGRHAADRDDAALAPLDNVEPYDTGEQDGTPQPSSLILTEQISEHPDTRRDDRSAHRPMLALLHGLPPSYFAIFPV